MDALAALQYLEKREDVDNGRIMVGGKGIGAVAALHAAFIWGKASKVMCLDMLSHYGALTDEFPNTWPNSIIIPDILKYYDLPDLAMCIASQSCVYILNPLDACRNQITENAASELYIETINRKGSVFCGFDNVKAHEALINAILY